jgi:hypothetical protein
VAARAVDLDEVASRRDGVDERGFLVERGAQLVEVGDGDLGAQAHAAGVGRDLPQDELEQRGLAAAVGADHADLVAAHHAPREVLDHPLVAVGLAHVLQLGDEAPGALARGERKLHRSQQRAPRLALRAQRLEPAYPALVARAPGLHALANPGFLLREHLVELARAHLLVRQLLGLALLVFGVVARVRVEAPAVELDHAMRDAVEEAAVVRDEDHAAGKAGERLLQPFDRLDVEVVGRLVEQQQVGLEDERTSQRHALAHAAGELVHEPVRGQLQAVERRLDAMLDRPGVGVVECLVQLVHAVEVARVGGRVVVEQQLPRLADTEGDDLEHGLARLERRLLLDARHLDAGRHPHLAVVRARTALDDPQQARLPGAVAPDEADVLARLDHEVGVVEQRHVAIGEGGFGELEQRHGSSIILGNG